MTQENTPLNQSEGREIQPLPVTAEHVAEVLDGLLGRVLFQQEARAIRNPQHSPKSKVVTFEVEADKYHSMDRGRGKRIAEQLRKMGYAVVKTDNGKGLDDSFNLTVILPEDLFLTKQATAESPQEAESPEEAAGGNTNQEVHDALEG